MKPSVDGYFSKVALLGFLVYAFAMPLVGRSLRAPIDLRRYLGRQASEIKDKRFRKSGSRWSVLETGRFENRSLLTMKLGEDANGMINCAVLSDSAFQPKDLEEVATLCTEFLKKHRLWSLDMELILDRHRDRILVKEMANVHPMVAVEISAGSEGISIVFGKR